MSNAERQRRFRESHPGYFGRYRMTRRRALANARALALKAAAAQQAPAPDAAPIADDAAVATTPPLPPPTGC